MAAMSMRYSGYLTEEDVGIKGYVSSSKTGLRCVFRERYSDFVVHEIDSDGCMAEVQNQDTVPGSEEDEAIAFLSRGNAEVASELKDVLSACEGSVVLQGVRLAEARSYLDEDSVLVEEMSPDAVVVKARERWVSGKKRKSRSERRRYTRFAVLKENADTMQVAQEIGQSLGVRHVGYAGTKDRRGITTQWMTVRQVPAERVLSILKRKGKFQIGNVHYTEKGLELGDLRGNRFEIALRDCELLDGHSKKALFTYCQSACDALGKNGFCNYFGLQRFGLGGSSNSQVGLALLKAEWKHAVHLILAPRQADDDKALAYKRAFLNNDLDLARHLVPYSARIEATVINTLHSSKNNFLSAIKALPRNMQKMYLHAHQSLIFNQLASGRLALYGPKPVLGDLVLVHPTPKIPAATNQLQARPELDFQRVKRLEKHDLNHYTAFDILLPLPGYKTMLPSFTGIDTLLQQTDMLSSPDDYRCLDGHKTFALPGTYRHLLVRPSNLSWRILPYSEKHDQLITTDIDRLSLATNTNKRPRLSSPPFNLSFSFTQENTSSSFLALILAFDLPASSYATCCLRELTKSSMSKESHHAGSHSDPPSVAAAAAASSAPPPKLSSSSSSSGLTRLLPSSCALS